MFLFHGPTLGATLQCQAHASPNKQCTQLTGVHQVELMQQLVELDPGRINKTLTPGLMSHRSLGLCKTRGHFDSS